MYRAYAGGAYVLDYREAGAQAGTGGQPRSIHVESVRLRLKHCPERVLSLLLCLASIRHHLPRAWCECRQRLHGSGFHSG
jgi:hypothetical protein